MARVAAAVKPVLVWPAPGVTIYQAGGHIPFPPGHAVPMHPDHVDDVIAEGHGALKPWAEHLADLEAAAKAATGVAQEAEQAAQEAEQTAEHAAEAATTH